jgi:hypothetical protein
MCQVCRRYATDLILSCPPAGPATAYESLFSDSRHGENFVFDFCVRSALARVSKDGNRHGRASGHPSRCAAKAALLRMGPMFGPAATCLVGPRRSLSSLLSEHDLFPKTGIHFSGSCSSDRHAMALNSPLGEGAMWKSEIALLIYLAAAIWIAVAARPLVARYLTARPPGMTWQLVP